MDKFVEVGPLKVGRGIEQHIYSAHIVPAYGTQYCMMGRNVYDYEQTIALQDWLAKATGYYPTPPPPRDTP